MSSRILVIDDSATIRKLVELSFRDLPLSVEYAQTGAEGLSRARAATPDVILLDVILPDMKGVEVCQGLSKEPKTASIAVVLMTGKDVSIRDQFRGFPQVVGYLRKPFTASDLVRQVNSLTGEAAQKRIAVQLAPRLSFEKREAIAQALYAKLKPHLAFIPEWMEQLGTAKPSSFFARRLLSPEVMGEMAEALVPMLQTGGESPAPAAGPLSGLIRGFPLLEILRLIAATSTPGVLELAGSTGRAWAYFGKAGLLLVTSDLVTEYLRGAEFDLSGVPEAQRERAVQEQQKSGKPMFVSLAESGLVSSAQLPQLLHQQGTKVLLSFIGAPEIRYAWVPSALPLFVEANGRSISFDQIRLEQLRSAPVGAEPPESLQWVFERVTGFSRHLRQFSLTDPERRVLTLVDGRHSMAKVAHRSGLQPREVIVLLQRLVTVGLIRRADRTKTARKVVIVDVNADMIRPLQHLLSRRTLATELVPISPDQPDLAGAIRRETPSLLILCVSAISSAALDRLSAQLETPELNSLETIAVLDDPARGNADQLLLSGFDHALIKPVAFSDIERILEERNG
jgi:CheY-like chemotaxis protein